MNVDLRTQRNQFTNTKTSIYEHKDVNLQRHFHSRLWQSTKAVFLNPRNARTVAETWSPSHPDFGNF